MLKKILCLAPHLSTGGCPQYLYKKLTVIKDLFDVLVVEYENVSDEYVVQKQKIIDLIGQNRLITLDADKSELKNIINRFEPDIIHLEEMNEYFLDEENCNFIFNEYRSKCVVYETSHDSSFDIGHKRHLPDKFVFVSRFQLDHFAPLNVDSELLEYPLIKQHKDQKTAQDKLGLSAEQFHILNVGLFTPRKNQKEIIEVAKRFLDNKDIVFHFVGNNAPNFQNYWEPLFNNLPVNCKVWGERNDVENFYNAADLFYFASKGTVHDKETNPLVIRESLSFNLPILMYNLPVYKNMYNNTENVFFLDFDNFDLNVALVNTLYTQWKQRKEQKVLVKKTVDLSWNGEDNKLHFTWGGEKVLQSNVVVKDINNDLIIYSCICDLEPRFNYWIVPIQNVKFDKLNGFNGFKVDFCKPDGELLCSETIKLNNYAPLDDFKFQSNNKDLAWYGFYQMFYQKCYDYAFEKREINTVVDVGCNIGVFTRLAIKNGAKKVYAIEPDKETLSILARTFPNQSEVVPLCIGLGGKDRNEIFYSSNGNSTLSSFVKEHMVVNRGDKIGFQEQKTQIKTLKTLIAEQNIEQIDLLKIDVEGFEYEILESFIDNPSVYGKIKSIILEFHSVDTRFDKIQSIVNKINKQWDFSIKYYNVDGVELSDLDKTRINYIIGIKNERIEPIKKKIKAVHLLTLPDTEREKKSIKSLAPLSKYGIEYKQIVNTPYTGLPPSENCLRPNDIAEKPGMMKLTGAHFGCYSAHTNAILNEWSDDLDGLLIFECDGCLIKPVDKFVKMVEQTFEECEKYGIRMFSYGPAYLNENSIDMGYYNIDHQLYEMHAYLITKSNISFVQDRIRNTKWDVFDLWVSSALHDQKLAVLKTPYAMQAQGFSLLDQKESKENWHGQKKI